MINSEMKLRTTTPASTSTYLARVTAVVALIVMAVAVPMQFFAARPSTVAADEYDAKIQALKQKISGYQDQANALREQSNTLQNTLNGLAADKAAIQTQIDLYQTQYDQLVKDIDATKKRIEENRKSTGQLIVESSMSGDVPLIVRLASSENLADYIDNEASRTRVRDSIVQKTEESARLKQQLEQKQSDVKKVLDEQKQKRDELASKEAIQQDLLAKTQGNEDTYRNMIASSQDEIKRTQEQQQAAYERARASWGGGYINSGGSGGYPWSAQAGVPYPCWSASCIDPWGVYYRECVSYVAWKLSSQGYGVKGFGGAGNANQWPATTRSYTTQSSTPHVGDALVMYSVGGDYSTGHVMYVEDVNSDGSIDISEYNFKAPGVYSERNLSKSYYNNSNFVFLTFPRR